jgi:hypothetical protein
MTGRAQRAVLFLRRAVSAALVFAIRAYQVTLSPLLGECCRYVPTCSAYAIEAVRVHGPVKGSLLAAWRVLRCHPFARGGRDPVPPKRRASEDAG